MSAENITLTPEYCLQISIVKGDDSEVLSGLWYVGVIMSIIASIASNMGVNVQKFSLMKEEAKAKTKEGHKERAYIFQPLWVAGLLLIIVGSIGDFAALGFAAQTLATPVGGFTMVANVFFAHFGLKEKIGRRDIVATILVILGVVGVAISADKTQKTYTLDCILQLYRRQAFLIYVVLFIAVIAATYAMARYLDKLRKEKNPRYRLLRKFHPICVAGLSGLIGAQSVLFAKCTAELFKATFRGENQFQNGETYIIILGLFATIFSQIHSLAQALKLFDAVIIVPVFQCFFITGGVVGGGIFFDEFSNLAGWELALFFVGLSVTVSGVILLAQREHQHDVHEHPVDEDVGIAVTGHVSVRSNKVVPAVEAAQSNAVEKPQEQDTDPTLQPHSEHHAGTLLPHDSTPDAPQSLSPLERPLRNGTQRLPPLNSTPSAPHSSLGGVVPLGHPVSNS